MSSLGSGDQHLAARVDVAHAEIDDVVTAVAHGVQQEIGVEARLGRRLELSGDARRLLAGRNERRRERLQAVAQQQNACDDEQRKQQQGAAEAAAERRVELGGVDLDHHAEPGESDRTVRGEDAAPPVVEHRRDAGFAIERAAHRQRPAPHFAVVAACRRVRADRRAIHLLHPDCGAQRHLAGVAPRVGFELEPGQGRKRLLGEHVTEVSVAVTDRQPRSQVIGAILLQQLGARRSRQRDRQVRRRDERA